MSDPLKRRYKRSRWAVIEVLPPEGDACWVAPPEHPFPFVGTFEDAASFPSRHDANAFAETHLGGHDWHTVRMFWDTDAKEWSPE